MQRGKPMLFLDGYLYVFSKRLANENELWRCSEKSLCSRTIQLSANRDKVVSGIVKCHDCVLATGKFKATVFKAVIKKEAKHDVTKNPSAILRDNLSSADEETRAHLVPKESLKRTIRYQQAADFPKAPSTFMEIEALPDPLTKIDGKPWLMKDVCKNGRCFIFATQEGIRILGMYYLLLPIYAIYLQYPLLLFEQLAVLYESCSLNGAH